MRTLIFASAGAINGRSFEIHVCEMMMAKKRTLRTLSSELPDYEGTHEILLNLHQQPDRDAAIVGASLIESALQERLINSFAKSKLDYEAKLFEDRGPLSDFNSKILISQAFGVIPDRLAEDMQRIRRIRNCFAHARIAVSFDEPLISKDVSELAAVLAVQGSMKKYPEVYPAGYDRPKTSYGLSCYIIFTILKSKDLFGALGEPEDECDVATIAAFRESL